MIKRNSKGLIKTIEDYISTDVKRVLVTGAAGSIGSELVRQLAPKHKVYCIDINETGLFDLIEELKLKGHWIEGRLCDVRDRKTLADIFSDFKPQAIYHAAALKHVSPAEKDPRPYIETNSVGTLNLIEVSKNWECFEKFVYISTDKVIHGKSVMGQTKKLGETFIQNAGRGFVAVRFGNVLGSRGSVAPIWQRQIDQNESLTVTDKRMTRYFMTIPEAVELVIEAGEKGTGGEIYILDMGEQVNIYELALQILKKANKEYLGIKLIGMRPGETLNEKLMTEEEELRAVKEGKFYVIR